MMTPTSLDGAETSQDPLPIMVRTLVGNGFELGNIISKPGYILFDCHRYDEFGVAIQYTFALCDGSLSPAALSAVERIASRAGSRLVIVGTEECTTASPPTFTWPSFLARFGGPIRSWLPLEPTFAEHLSLLGHNKEIPGVIGRPDELFEEYVQVALQFLLANRVIRYGQERRGEAVPDGVAMGREALTILYDAKAYTDGYEVTASSIRQFADYVRRFHDKYERYVGRVHAFVVISGAFKNKSASRKNQSRELYRACGIPLAFLAAAELGAATAKLAETPSLRLGVDWRDVFSHDDITLPILQNAISAGYRDHVVRE